MEQVALLERAISESGDALQSMMLRKSLVWAYAMLDEPDLALDHVDALLAVPSMMSTPYLRVAPLPDVLRRHPRYRQLLGDEGPEVAQLIWDGVRLAVSLP
jgi:hypothetical protein